MLDAELFLQPQYVLHGETHIVPVIMISHGKRLHKNVGLRVKCPLHLTDFNQNRDVQANFKSLNMKFHKNLSDGRHFVPCGLAAVTKLTVFFHIRFSSASKMFILTFWLTFNARSLQKLTCRLLWLLSCFPYNRHYWDA
jgi:hypothetical protein